MFPFMFLKSGAFLGFILQQYGCTTAMKGREDSFLEAYSEASLNGILSLLKWEVMSATRGQAEIFTVGEDLQSIYKMAW